MYEKYYLHIEDEDTASKRLLRVTQLVVKVNILSVTQCFLGESFKNYLKFKMTYVCVFLGETNGQV